MSDYNFEILSLQEVDITCDQETVDIEERKDSFANETTNKNSFSPVSSEKSPKVEDNYEPIDIEGQKETGIWVHHPGSEVSQTWEPRKGKSRRLDTEIHGEHNGSSGNCKPPASEPLNDDSSSPDDNSERKHGVKSSVKRGLHKIGSVLHRSGKKEDQFGSPIEDVPSPHANIRSVNAKGVGLRFVMEDSVAGFPTGEVQVEGGSTEGSGPENPVKGNVKDMAKNILKHAEKSAARGIRHVLSCKSRRHKGDAPTVPERETLDESDSSDDESLSVQSPEDERIPVVSQAMASSSSGSPNSNVVVVHTVPSNTPVDNEVPIKKVIVQEDPKKVSSPDRPDEEFVKHVEPKRDKKEVVADKRDISLST